MRLRIGGRAWRQRSPASPGATRCTHFASSPINDELAKQGFAVLPQRLDRDLVDALSALYDGVRREAGDTSGGRFTPSMTITRPDLRSRLWDGVTAIAAPVVDPVFEPGHTEVMGGSFVLKPASPDSIRNPHQDPSTFDESRHVGISIWIPLTDSTLENGTLHLLPGSHRMGNDIRPPDVANFTDEVAGRALAESVPVELERGQMLVIDGAVIHHSPPNLSAEDRVACIVALRPVGATMSLMRSDGGADSGTATLHTVDVEMFRSGNLMEPALDEAAPVRHAPYAPATPDDLARSMRAA